ncbi:SPASM domain-containing protein [Candidatus Sumerlaeota bacterium]|nr:SPASM domain-containing protein [Candidatus Sumerlaeota bacterium]
MSQSALNNNETGDAPAQEYALNDALNTREYQEGRLTLQSAPSIMNIGLTVKCNLDCIMCFSRHLPQIDLDGRAIEQLLRFLPRAHTIRWNDAGEIFASSRSPEFMRMMQAYHPAISYVSTNFLLAHRWIDDIFDSGLTDISVSIDAATQETFEKIRVGGKWDRLVENLTAFRDKRRELGRETPRLTFVYVAMKSNIGEMTRFVEFAHEYDAVAVHVLKLLPAPKGTEHEESPDPAEERRCYKQSLLRARELGVHLDHTLHSNDALWEEIRLEQDAELAPAIATPLHAAMSLGAIEDLGQASASVAERTTPAEPTQSTAGGDCATSLREETVLAFEPLHRRHPFWGASKPICPSPWREFLVQSDGLVRTCCFSPRIMGDLKTQTVEDIWNGPDYQAMRRQLVVQDFRDCPNCPYLGKVLTSRRDPYTETLNQLDQLATRSGRTFDIARHRWREFKFHLKRAVKESGRRGEHARLSLRHGLGAIGGYLRGALQAVFALYEQKRINQQLLQMLRISLERQERSREDLALLTEAMQIQSRLHAQSIGDGASLLDAQRMSLDQRMNALFYSVAWLDHDTPTTMKAGATAQVEIRLMNTSVVDWPTRGPRSVQLSYSWFDAQGNLRQLDGLRTPLPGSVPPHQPVTLRAALQAPPHPGHYALRWDLVFETVSWFRDKDCATLDVAVTIIPE